MPTLFKLTDSDGYTRRGVSGETCWPVGGVVLPTGTGDKPCGPGFLHLYASPEAAAIFRSIHGISYYNRLLEVRTDGYSTDGSKCWTSGPVTVLREVELPEISTEDRAAFAICIAPHEATKEWAIRWLSGKDRSWKAALTAAAAAWTTAAWAAAAAAVEHNALVVEISAARAAAAATDQVNCPNIAAVLGYARKILAGEIPATEYHGWMAREERNHVERG